MEKKKILLTAPWPRAAKDALKAEYTILETTGFPPSHDEILTMLMDADALCPTIMDTLDKNFFDALPGHIKLIASFGVGFDHIDLEAANNKGVLVTNTPGVVSIDTANVTIGLMIAALHRFQNGEKVLRSGDWQGVWNENLLGASLAGKTLGIVGLGRIGELVARRARAFDMDILYFSRTRKMEIEKELGLTCSPSLEALLAGANVISIHAPLTDKTRHLINANTLKFFKPGAYLINTSRGALIDEAALVKALESGHLGGAGLDVYEFEPKLAKGLEELETITILPHLGTATRETRTAMGLRVKANLDAFFKDGKPLDVVSNSS